MNDNKEVKPKKKTYEKVAGSGSDKITYNIEITDDSLIKFPKDAKDDTRAIEGELKIKVRKYKDGKEEGKEEVGSVEASNITYNGNFFSHGLKFKKFKIGTTDTELKEDLSLSTSGFKPQGWVVMGIGGLAILAIIGGLIWWMTRPDEEDKD